MRAAVVGRPISHSLSPLIHSAWLAAAGIAGDYRALTPEDGQAFDAFIYGLRREGLTGINVTLPFKPAALALADRSSARAAKAGAANLLVFAEDGIVADNTDGAGLLAALEGAGWGALSGPVVVLGAGGAARGALVALIEAGVTEVRVVNRSAERAEVLAELDAGARAFAWPNVAEALRGAAAVINATSLGMTGQPRLELDLSPLPGDAVVMDMVYQPLETELLAAARARGLTAADGLTMLIGQAIPSFEVLFGRPPPEIDVRDLCLAALAARR